MTHEQEIVRKKLESYVCAHNNVLKEVAPQMDIIILLRNADPVYRPDFARECLKVKLISLEETQEFVKVFKNQI